MGEPEPVHPRAYMEQQMVEVSLVKSFKRLNSNDVGRILSARTEHPMQSHEFLMHTAESSMECIIWNFKKFGPSLVSKKNFSTRNRYLPFRIWMA